MHSSRMRTVLCSGRLGEGGVCQGVVHLPPDKILDTRLWKHYLSATLLVDGNKTSVFVWNMCVYFWSFQKNHSPSSTGRPESRPDRAVIFFSSSTREKFFGFLLWKPDNDSNILAWFPQACRSYRFTHVLAIMETKCVMLCTFHKRYISTACDEWFTQNCKYEKKS